MTTKNKPIDFGFALEILQFQHRDFRCSLRRNQLGCWCGYVDVPVGHPWHGRNSESLYRINVHGGVTYAQENPETGEWRVGFDCCHGYDWIPMIGVGRKEDYRDVRYASRECERLANQAAEAAK